MKTQIKITISGSFRKHLEEVVRTIAEFENSGAKVLSPKFIKPKNPGSEFVLFEGEDTDSPRKLEDGHLRAIRQSDALYVVDPDGYAGNSAVMEIGFALALRKPVFAKWQPAEFILSQTGYVKAASVKEVVRLLKTKTKSKLYE